MKIVIYLLTLLWFYFVETYPCHFASYLATCPVQVSDTYPVEVTAIFNHCHKPMDITFILKVAFCFCCWFVIDLSSVKKCWTEDISFHLILSFEFRLWIKKWIGNIPMSPRIRLKLLKFLDFFQIIMLLYAFKWDLLEKMLST